MKNGKWFVIIGIIVIAVIGIWWWQSSSSPGEKVAEAVVPEMEVMSVNISNLSGERIDATGEVKISNSMPGDIKTNRIDYEIYVDSIKVIEDAYEEPVEIASSDSTVIELPMEILKEPAKRVLDYFDRHQIDSAEYTLNMNFRVDVPIAGENEFNMDITRKMPSFQLLNTELENIDTNLLSSDEGMDIVIRFENPNVYPIKMRNASFYMIVEDDLELRGDLEDVINIPPRGKEDVTVHVEKERGSITQTGLSLLFDQEGTGFKYFFSYTMVSDNEIFDGAQMESTVEGNLDELTDAM